MKPRPHLPEDSQDQTKERLLDVAELNRLAEELTALNLLGRKVSTSLSLEAVVASALEAILGTVKCDLAFLFLREGERLALAGIAPETRRELPGQILENRVGECMCGLAVRLGQPLYSPDIFADARCTWEECKMAGLRSFAALPLRGHEAIIGVLGLASRTQRDFAPQADFLETMAGTVAASLQNARLFAETKRAQEALEKSEAFRKRVFESSRIPIVVLDAETLQCVECNKAAAEIYHLPSREAMLGKTPADVSAAVQYDGTPSPEKASYYNERARANGDVIFEWRNRYPDGGHWDAEIHLVSFVSGKHPFFQLTTQDVTERKKSEEALRKSQANLEFAQSMALIGSWDLDLTEGKGRWSKEMFRLFGRDPALGEPNFADFIEMIHPEDRTQLLQAQQRVVESGEQCLQEFRTAPARGPIHHFASIIQAVKESSGPVRRIAGAVQDITERKQAEQKQREIEAQMQQAQKLESLGVLAGGIAHDFNNLLTAILGHANLALMDLPPESPACESLREIDKASGRAAELCRQMLAYAGKGHFVVEPVNLSRLVEELTRLLHVSISKKVLLRCQLAEELPAVDADPAQVRQLAMNLVINAADAIGDADGIITISTGTARCDENSLLGGQITAPPIPGWYVYLDVIDTGCGMDAKTQARIFEPFFTTKFAGRGLGLAAVLGIVRSNRGGLKVDSEPGRGTTFRVLFPASTKGAVPAKSDENPPPWRGKGTILLVDDEEPVRNVTGKILERSGFAVLRAGDGLEAIELFRAHSAEVVCVLLDLAMPRMDGEETFRELRRIQSDVHVILASGYSDQEISQRFQNMGLAGFIEKPYRVETLAAKLRGVLARHD
jgi:PAS domain S-box-containing protein